MKNIHAFLITLFSVIFISAGVLAQQNDVAPNYEDQLQLEKQMKEAKVAQKSMLSGRAESVSAQQEDVLKGKYLEKVPGNYVYDVDPNPVKSNITSSADDLFDLQFSWPAGVGGGEAGIETDGNYVYTTKWNGAGEFYRYDMDGTYIEVFTVAGAVGVRDMAYNGTYFYGGAATTTVFEMDLANGTLISQFTAPTAVRAIAYNEDDEVFYANNWSTDIVAFDATGANQGSFPVGPAGTSYYGLAYDNYCGGTYLWGYAQTDGTVPADQNWLVQIELPSGVETGVTFDVASIITPVTGIAGGLAISDEFVSGYWTILGNMQNEFLWGLELCMSGPPPTTDLAVTAIVDPSTGSGLTSAENVTVTIKNIGDDPQSNFDVYFTLDGGAPVTETYSGTLNSGETVDHTFATTVDLSVPGDYEIMACTDLAGDENPDNDCKTKTVSNLTQALVYPTAADYWTGTTDGADKTETSYIRSYGGSGGNDQGWMKFDVSSIPSGALINWIKLHCYVTATNFPYWSVTPMDIDPVTASGADIWNAASAGSGTTVAYAYNNEASTFAPGWHEYELINGATSDLADALVAGQDWFAVGIYERDGVDTYYLELDGWNETNVPYLEIDYSELDFGMIDGTVTELATSNPVQGAMITAMGPNFTYETMSGADGTYSIDPAEEGEYTIYCMMDGYNEMMETGVMVTAGATTTQDFALTAPTMDISPLSINVTLDPFQTTTETIDITNNGNGMLNWSASIINNTGKLDPTSEAFAYNAYDASGTFAEGPISFTLDDPATVTQFGSAASDFVATADWVDGTWYGCVYGGTLITIDMTTGGITVIGTSPDLSGMAYDWTTNEMYGVDFDGNLYTIDLATGAGTMIGTGVAGMITMVCDNTGTLYGWNLNDDSFGWIDKSTGAYNIINPNVGFDFIYAQDASVDHEDNTIYWAAYTTLGALYTIDQATGTPTYIGDFAGGMEVTGFAIPNPPSTWIGISPNSGMVDVGGTDQLTVTLDATDILPGTILEADVHFMSDPDVGEENVHVTLVVGDQQTGHVTGNVMLDGMATYNIGDVTEVLVEVGPYFAYPDANGDYDVEAYPGTYDVSATLYGYETQTVTGIVVAEAGLVENIDFTMPTLYGRIMGTVTDDDSGDPIENAMVMVVDTDFETMTAADGTYEIFIEAGTYDVMVDHPTYMAETETDVAVTAENDVTVDFALTYQCDFCDASGGNDEYIDGVEMGSISNLGTGYNTGYEDFTAFSTMVVPGNTYTLTIYTGNMYTSDDYGVWIDWNQDCTFDPATENVVCGIDMGADVNSWDITIPPDAVVGNATMRVRLKWSGSDCGDPCGTTSYGEVEDYTLMVIEPTYGDLEGTVTDADNGDPIAGATVSVEGIWETTTNATGDYEFIDLLTGDWEVTCSAGGYNTQTVTVTIEEGLTATQDFVLEAPGLEVDPTTIDITMDLNQIQEETITVSNPGLGDVAWTAAVVVEESSASDDLFDLQFSWPAGVAGGEAGIETDGNYVYTTKWNGTGEFYRYAMDGTYIEVFTVTGAAAVRDLAYDGTYFYGSAATTTVFEVDLANGTLVSQFVAPTAVRAIAWNEDEEVFYGNNWSTDVVAFDKSGANMGSFAVGPFGSSYYGFAYDNYSDGAPYLWGYAQTDGTVPVDQNWLVQMELPSGTETGVSFDVATIITPVTGIAGGLCISDAFVPGFYTLAGNMQNEFMFGLELCPAGPVWLSIAPNGGTLSGGGSEDVTATFNTFDMLPGIYNAEIQFTSTPDVGSPVVDVTLTIEGLIPPVNMEMDYECTDVMITWEMPTGGDPDSWNIYRDGAVIGTATPPNMEYMDEMVDPETDYEYHITAVYDGDESSGTAPETMNIPMPEDMEPTDAAAEHTGGLNVQITWMAPEACVAPDEYEVFRDGSSVGTTTDLEFNDVVPTGGVYQYHVVGKYYFGDSDNSNFAFVLVGIEENLADMFEIYPNPASSFVNVKADFTIESYELLNNAGQVIMAERADATSFRVNVAQYENGIYYIKLYTEQGVTLRKIAID